MPYCFVPGEGAIIIWGLWTIHKGALSHFGSSEGFSPLVVAHNTEA